MQKSTVIVVLGQTATGKSDLAVKIAKKLARRGGNKNLPANRHGKVPKLDNIKATGNLSL